jgi:hypothetical protein
MEEVFKVIKEYPEYEVSNYGQIRYKNNIINGDIDQNGYMYFDIYNETGDKIIDGKRIHWQVANAFLPNIINNEQIVKHKDGNRKNNNVSNLYLPDSPSLVILPATRAYPIAVAGAEPSPRGTSTPAPREHCAVGAVIQ